MQRYLLARLPGLPGFLVFIALRQYLAGRTLTRPAMWVIFVSNALNVFLNWVLIFGKLGFPALGLVGAGLATALTNLLLPLMLWIWIRSFRLHEGAWRSWDRRSVDLHGLGRFVRLGWPVGLHMFLEANAFGVAMLMVGWLGIVELGAHQIVINMASLTYMVPLGLSIGAAARVGNLIGARDPLRVRVACRDRARAGRGRDGALRARLRRCSGTRCLVSIWTTRPSSCWQRRCCRSARRSRSPTGSRSWARG